MHIAVIPITLAFIAGLLLAHGFLYFPYSIIIVSVCGIITAGVLVWRKRVITNQILLVSFSLLIGFIAYLHSAAWLPADHYTRFVKPDSAFHTITGVISSSLDRHADRTAFLMNLSALDGVPVSGKIRVSIREGAAPVGQGDIIRIHAKLMRPKGYKNPDGFDYPAYLQRKGVFYTAGIRDFTKLEILHRGTGIFRTIQDWRERIRQSFLNSITGSGGAILQAMVIGEEGELTEELRDQFMAAGVTHIISISGSHLGMVAIFCFGLLKGLMFLLPQRPYHFITLHMDPKKIAAFLTLPLVIFYTFLAGGQVATIRSLIMISAGLFALILDREHAILHSLAYAALILLIADPQAIFDISFQLSYISVLVIGFVVIVWNDRKIEPQNRTRKVISSTIVLIAISCAVSLATGPLVAHYFNQFSFVGILSNSIIIPFAGLVVVPLGLFSGILSLTTHELPFAGILQIICEAFVNTVSFFASLPFGEFHLPAPGVFWLSIYAMFLVSIAVITRAKLRAAFHPLENTQRGPRAALITLTICLIILISLFGYPLLSQKTTEVHFPDVGQGDCSFIMLRSGKTILIDGGGTFENRFDVGRRVLAPYLWNKGIRHIDLVILSHPHPDHMNGLLAILKKFTIDEVWESEQYPDLPGHNEFRRILDERNIVHKIVQSTSIAYQLGEADLQVLHPDKQFKANDRQAYAQENNRSLVVRIAFDNISCLYPGDIGRGAEEYLVKMKREIGCAILKVPHHGSKNSSSELFVAATHPRIAVITVGTGNPYHHPAHEVVARYQRQGAKIRRTDQDGAVIIRIKGNQLETVRWNDRILRKIDMHAWESWKTQEKENWERVQSRWRDI
ncbi:MAG: DNA internalization-related competence protein ComEC/Rec2 [Nitrospirota bacterium]